MRDAHADGDRAGTGEEAAPQGPDADPELEFTPAVAKPSPRPRPRSRKSRLLRQWRRGLRGDWMTILLRTVPEDPLGIYPPDVLKGLDAVAWDAASQPWEEASIALGATLRGRLLGATLGLVPDRHHWRVVIHMPGEDPGLLSEPWRDLSRCLAAARTRFAAEVIAEASLWTAAETLGLDDHELRTLVAHSTRQPLKPD